MIKVIIFDFDGVIVDSLSVKHQTFFDVLSDLDEKSKKIAFRVIEETKGQPRYEKFRKVFIELNRPKKQLEELVAEYVEKYNELAEQKILEIGIDKESKKTLFKLSKKYNLYINSSTPHKPLVKTVARLGINKFFKNIYGLPKNSNAQEDSKERSIKKIMKDEKVKGSETIFIGDHENDFSAAVKCNCYFIGVYNTRNNWKGKNFPIVKNISQVKTVLKNKNFLQNKNLFKSNNHSKYKIKWKKIPEELEKNIKVLISNHYGYSPKGPIKEVDAWEVRSNNFRIPLKLDKKKYVLLRKHIRLKKPEDILSVDEVLYFLKSEKIRVPEVIKTSTGEELFENNGFYYQLYKYIDGNHYCGSDSQLKIIAREIAYLHQALSKIPLQNKFGKKATILKKPSDKNWQELFELAETGKKWIDNFVYSQKVLIIEALGAANSTVKNKIVRKQVIRGDLHPHDVIFNGDQFVSFLDFEGVRFGELIRDVGNAAHRFVRQNIIFEKKAWQKELAGSFETFIYQYQKVNNLEEKEIKLIPYFILDETLGKIFRILKANYLEEDMSKMSGGELEKQTILLKEGMEILKAFESL